ncbi:MAG: alpha/beta fold hydrolase [Opitutae bacterium]|nr:alpha/beta fold hydrolase [Opitutae bacterium]
MSKSSPQFIAAADGHPIAARFFAPAGSPRGVVLVAPAMGCPQTYYAPFAAWLAAQGFLAATFDYRGTGLSHRGSLRGFRADLWDWARLDCGAMVAELDRRAPEVPLHWVGHSLGGQIIPFVPGRERIKKIVTVATGSGYWRENSPALRRMVWWLWFVVVPLALPLAGYFPGKRLRKVGDLPKGVMAQWRKWCLHPEYAAGAEGAGARAEYAAVRTPITSLSFTDDEMMSARNIESLHSFYTNAPRTMRRFSPAEAGVARIGHFGFFRKDARTSLWPDLLLPELA